MLMPLLTEADPKTSSEGSIDPLGTYAIADTLAVRLAPGIRERQKHPRFLTTSAVSLSVCSEFPEEKIASDGVSEPWQVFEWYAVEGFIRSSTEPSELAGLPGINKVKKAIHEGVPISSGNYLKTPSVFGFHGVYRVLSRTLGVEAARRLGDLGYELLSTWAKEQGIKGFIGTIEGPGQKWRKLLIDSVRDGLLKGAVDRSTSWDGWRFFGNLLNHHRIGKLEADLITNALMGQSRSYVRPMINFLISSNGKNIWNDSRAERDLHIAMVSESEGEFTDLLNAILQYEFFSRLLQDAFDDCLLEMSETKGKTTPEILSGLKGVKRAVSSIQESYFKVIERLSPFGEAVRFQEAFVDLAKPSHNIDWVIHLIEHHCKVQLGKPPEGKAPWIERFDDGSYAVRPGYRRDRGGRHDDEYVHGYRAGSLWSFAVDLGMVK